MSGIARSLVGGRAQCAASPLPWSTGAGEESLHPPVLGLHGAKSDEWRQTTKGRPGRPKRAARMRAGTEISRRISSNPAAHLRRGGLNIGRKGQADDRPQLSFAAIDSISETS
jgi:hypothetical protein